MKIRIISGIIGTMLLLVVLFCPHSIVLNIVAAALTAIAVYEMLHNTGRVKNTLLVTGSMVYAIAQVFHLYKQINPTIISGLTIAYALYLFLIILRYHETIDISAIGYAFAATVYVTTGFGALSLLRALPTGLFGVLLAFVIPFTSDTGAYFIGTFFGKHKMTPIISPKKSWEGFWGGLIISILSSVVFAIIYRNIIGQGTVDYIRLAVIVFVLAPLSVCGDLIASVIKRQSGIKDYGNIMPGHGGVMDRFDSVIMVAPILYIIMRNIPILS